MATHSSTLAWKIPGWRSLVGYSPCSRQESDTTERLHFHFSLSCIGEGNGTSLQCSCLENPRDGGAQWAAVYGVAQSRTRLKRQKQQQQLQAKECQGLAGIIRNQVEAKKDSTQSLCGPVDMYPRSVSLGFCEYLELKLSFDDEY